MTHDYCVALAALGGGGATIVFLRFALGWRTPGEAMRAELRGYEEGMHDATDTAKKHMRALADYFNRRA